jgi:hypothetical protein
MYIPGAKMKSGKVAERKNVKGGKRKFGSSDGRPEQPPTMAKVQHAIDAENAFEKAEKESRNTGNGTNIFFIFNGLKKTEKIEGKEVNSCNTCLF